jgi:hypothetical protein
MVGKPEWNRTLLRSRRGWEDGIKMGMRELVL